MVDKKPICKLQVGKLNIEHATVGSVTKKINGGTNGLTERKLLTTRQLSIYDKKWINQIELYEIQHDIYCFSYYI